MYNINCNFYHDSKKGIRKCTEEIKSQCSGVNNAVYLEGGDFSEPSSRRRNTLPGPSGKGLQGPESSPLTGWGHPGPGTSSSNRAEQERKQEYARLNL